MLRSELIMSEKKTGTELECFNDFCSVLGKFNENQEGFKKKKRESFGLLI